MLSLPPPHEWGVHWLCRLTSLDGEQCRHYTATFRQDVRTLQQQANGAPSERVLAAVRLQLVSSCAVESSVFEWEPRLSCVWQGAALKEGYCCPRRERLLPSECSW